MSRPLAVLRPAPGDAATAARIEALGRVALRLPLFAVRPIDWRVPDGDFEALLVTSANALRHGGGGLAALRALPVLAVGEATAAAARAAGFVVEATGGADARALIAAAGGGRRLLHLAGRERGTLAGVDAVAVYAADAIDVDARALAGSVALVHSARAARRLGALVADRRTIRVAALSAAVAAAAGTGWDRIVAAGVPTDAALVALAVDQAD